MTIQLIISIVAVLVGGAMFGSLANSMRKEPSWATAMILLLVTLMNT